LVESRSLGGIMKEAALDTIAVELDQSRILLGAEATAVRLAAEAGQRADVDDDTLDAACAAADMAREIADRRAGDRYVEFLAENGRICDQREATARSFSIRKLAEVERRIANAAVDSKAARIIPALKGQVRNLEQELSLKLDRINRAREVVYSTRTVAVGLLVVE
jgi:hypothetical protein